MHNSNNDFHVSKSAGWLQYKYQKFDAFRHSFLRLKPIGRFSQNLV